MDKLWACLHSVKDSFHVFACCIICEFVVQLPSTNGKDEQELSLTAVKLKLRAVMLFSPWRAGMHLISSIVMAGRPRAVV